MTRIGFIVALSFGAILGADALTTGAWIPLGVAALLGIGWLVYLARPDPTSGIWERHQTPPPGLSATKEDDPPEGP